MKGPRKYRIGASYTTTDGQTGVICGYLLDSAHTKVTGIQVRLRAGHAGTVEITLPRREWWVAG